MQENKTCHSSANDGQKKSTINKGRDVRVQRISHPDHRAQRNRIRRVKGQLDGVERMIEENRYCMEILTQIRAAKSALAALEVRITETHLRSCVRSAFSSENAFDVEEKIQEILKMLSE